MSEHDWRVVVLPDGREVEFIHAGLLGLAGGEYVCEVSYTVDGSADSVVVRVPVAAVSEVGSDE